MKLTFTYDTQVDVVVDLDTGKVESISAIKQLGSPMNGVEGFIHVSSDTNPFSSPDEIAAINRDSMAKVRAKSTRAKRLLESTGHLHCETCHDNGFVMEGDRDYPCPDCHVEGIVQVVQVGDVHP